MENTKKGLALQQLEQVSGGINDDNLHHLAGRDDNLHHLTGHDDNLHHLTSRDDENLHHRV